MMALFDDWRTWLLAPAICIVLAMLRVGWVLWRNRGRGY